MSQRYENQEQEFEGNVFSYRPMHKIFALFCNYNIISEVAYHAVLQKLITTEYKAGDTIISPETPQDIVYFVGEGITRNFYKRQNQQWTLSFDVAGDCIMTSSNFIDNDSSLDFVEACTDVKLYGVLKTDFQSLIMLYPDLEKVSRKILERRLARFEKRLRDLYTLTEEKLFKKFVEDFPMLVNSVEDSQLASYLRMNGSTYTKLKKRLLSEKKMSVPF